MHGRGHVASLVSGTNIAIVPQIFQNKVFIFTFWGSFPYKKEEKKVFMKNLPGASNNTLCGTWYEFNLAKVGSYRRLKEIAN
jgi:hypothetical protein